MYFYGMDHDAKRIIEKAKEIGYEYSVTSQKFPSFPNLFVVDGILILSKHPIISKKWNLFKVLPFYEYSLWNKGFLEATIQYKEKKVCVISTHLSCGYQVILQVLHIKNNKINLIPNENNFGLQQFKHIVTYIEKKKKKTAFDHLVITGDLNVANPKFYNKLKKLFESIGLRDAYFDIHGYRKETFGVLDEQGKPLETLLTRKSDIGKMECLDYILTDLVPLQAEVNHFKESQKNKPW